MTAFADARLRPFSVQYVRDGDSIAAAEVRLHRNPPDRSPLRDLTAWSTSVTPIIVSTVCPHCQATIAVTLEGTTPVEIKCARCGFPSAARCALCTKSPATRHRPPKESRAC